jgi:tyrosyl-tRNA synthetase
LRDIGKHITVNQMMHKETVKRRLEDPDQSISYTEFSYMLLQGYDFVRLYQDKDVRLQICGSDQRGNGVTGLEMIRKMIPTAKQCYVTTCPLILDSTGKKFGKSEGNALWLSTHKNSPYVIYQYFMNTIDEDVARFLKLLTLLSKNHIESIVQEHFKQPELRVGQRELASYVTATIFGQAAADQAVLVSEFMFGSQDKVLLLQSMSSEQLDAIAQEI